MIHRQLGRSGLQVSQLALGTMTFGGGGRYEMVGANDASGARRQLDMALDAGVNLIDTADAYSDGRAEEILGEILAGRREKIVLATKARFATGPGVNDAGSSRNHLIEACEASLRRLRTDHIDLYQLHEWDGLTPLEETISVLEHLIASGKVRYVGCSNFAGWHLMKAMSVASPGPAAFVSNQIYLSLNERSAEYEIIPSCIDQGVGTLIWSPLAGGLLSGKYRRDNAEPEGTRRAAGWRSPPIQDEATLYDTIDVLLQIAASRDVSPAQVAIAWLTRRPGVTSVILGARTTDQLADNLAAADLVLSDQEQSQLEKVSRPPLIYPFWHHLKLASDRLSEADLSLIRPYLEESRQG